MQPSDRPAPLGRDFTRMELRMFDLFRKEIAFLFSEDNEPSFWTVHMQQAAHTYLPIWHGCLALAAIHKRQHLLDQQTHPQWSEESTNLYIFAIRQCTLAMEQVRTSLQQDQIRSRAQCEELFISSLLFAGISSLLGDLKHVVPHVEALVPLYNELKLHDGSTALHQHRTQQTLSSSPSSTAASPSIKTQDKQSSSPWIAPTPPRPASKDNGHIFSFPILDALISRVHIPIVTLAEPSDLLPHQVHNQPRQPCPRAPDGPYPTWEAASLNMRVFMRYSLQTLRALHFTAAAQATKPPIEPFQEYYHQIMLCKDKIDALWADCNAKAPKDKFNLQLQLVETIWLCTYIYGGQAMDYIAGLDDGYTQTFKQLLQRIEEQFEARATQSQHQHQKQQPSNPIFSFTDISNDALLLLGFDCRESKTRWKAIRLLYNSPQRDAYCDTRWLAAICAARATVEESGVLEEVGCKCVKGQAVCHRHRVATTVTTLGTDNSVVLEIATLGDIQSGSPCRQIELDWRG